MSHLATKKSGDLAVYRRIEHDLRDKIRAGRWTAGAILPSRCDLAAEYRVSSGTIRRAVEILISEGTLHAEDGRGTFVARAPALLEQKTAALSPPSASVPTPSLVPRRIKTVGIVGSIYANWNGVNSQDCTILQSIEHALSQFGVVTKLQNTHLGQGHLSPLTETIEKISTESIDGLILICLDRDRLDVEAALAQIELKPFPIICVLAGEIHLPIPHIFYDNRMGGFQAAKHLIDRGHRSLSVITPTTASWATERLAGMQSAIAHAKMPADSLTVISGDGRPWHNMQDPIVLAYNAVRAALNSGWELSGGIVGITDDAILGLLEAAAETPLTVGVDFATVGFDDHPNARAHGLTSMRPPWEDMGREAVRLLMDDTNGVQTSRQIRLCAHLIPRTSSQYMVGSDAG